MIRRIARWFDSTVGRPLTRMYARIDDDLLGRRADPEPETTATDDDSTGGPAEIRAAA